MRVTNTGSITRRWNQLKNLQRGTTLELAPGESAETDVPEGFEDPWLKPADGETAKPETEVPAVPAPPAPPTRPTPPTPADAANTEE